MDALSSRVATLLCSEGEKRRKGEGVEGGAFPFTCSLSPLLPCAPAPLPPFSSAKGCRGARVEGKPFARRRRCADSVSLPQPRWAGSWARAARVWVVVRGGVGGPAGFVGDGEACWEAAGIPDDWAAAEVGSGVGDWAAASSGRWGDWAHGEPKRDKRLGGDTDSSLCEVVFLLPSPLSRAVAACCRGCGERSAVSEVS